MASLEVAIAEYLSALRGERSYKALADELGIAESTVNRLIEGDQSATLQKIEEILRKKGLSLTDVFGEVVNRKWTRCR